MHRLLGSFLILLTVQNFVIGYKSNIILNDDDMYELDKHTNVKRLKFVKQVVDDHMAKDFPRIRDCGSDELQNWYEPDPEDCSCYFVCTGRYYIHRRCSHGLMFDPESEQCNWPEVVSCGDRPEPWTLPAYNGPAQHIYNNIDDDDDDEEEE